MLGILNKTLGKIFGSKSERDLKELNPFVDKIKNEYASLGSLSHDELRGRSDVFRERIRQHTHETATEIFELEHENAMLRAKLDVNEALRAGRAAKSSGKAKARKGPRRRR